MTQTTKTTDELIMIACNPFRPRWMRELGADLDRTVRSLDEAKVAGRSAVVISCIQDVIDSLARQIEEAA